MKSVIIMSKHYTRALRMHKLTIIFISGSRWPPVFDSKAALSCLPASHLAGWFSPFLRGANWGGALPKVRGSARTQPFSPSFIPVPSRDPGWASLAWSLPNRGENKELSVHTRRKTNPTALHSSLRKWWISVIVVVEITTRGNRSRDVLPVRELAVSPRRIRISATLIAFPLARCSSSPRTSGWGRAWSQRGQQLVFLHEGELTRPWLGARGGLLPYPSLLLFCIPTSLPPTCIYWGG